MAFSLDFNVLVQGGVLALLLYIARLLAFVLILIAVADRNRRR